MESGSLETLQQALAGLVVRLAITRCDRRVGRRAGRAVGSVLDRYRHVGVALPVLVQPIGGNRRLRGLKKCK